MLRFSLYPSFGYTSLWRSYTHMYTPTPKKRPFLASFQVIVQATGNALTKAVTAAEACGGLWTSRPRSKCLYDMVNLNRTPFWMKGVP